MVTLFGVEVYSDGGVYVVPCNRFQLCAEAESFLRAFREEAEPPAQVDGTAVPVALKGGRLEDCAALLAKCYEQGTALVGGVVRDALNGEFRRMGVLPQFSGADVPRTADVDGATKHLPDAAAAILEKNGYNVLNKATIRNGGCTVRAFPRGRKGMLVEVTTLRCDTGGGSVVLTTEFPKDAARRDLRMNAVYLFEFENHYVFVDPYGGVNDLLTRQVIVNGCPVMRWQECGVRILRYFRFLLRYSDRPDVIPDSIVEAMEKCCDVLKDVPREQIYSELRALHAIEGGTRYIIFLYTAGILGGAGLPFAKDAPVMQGQITDDVPLNAIITGCVPMSSLAEDVLRAIWVGFKVSDKERHFSCFLVREQSWLRGLPAVDRFDAIIRRLAHTRGNVAAAVQADYYQLCLFCGFAGLAARLANWNRPDHPLDLLPHYQGLHAYFKKTFSAAQATERVKSVIGLVTDRWVVSGFTATRNELYTYLNTILDGNVEQCLPALRKEA